MGYSVLDGMVTIDLTSMNAVVVAPDNKTVRVQVGLQLR